MGASQGNTEAAMMAKLFLKGGENESHDHYVTLFGPSCADCIELERRTK